MDLSSLEGPPLNDSRFTIPSQRRVDQPNFEISLWNLDMPEEFRPEIYSPQSRRSLTDSILQTPASSSNRTWNSFERVGSRHDTRMDRPSGSEREPDINREGVRPRSALLSPSSSYDVTLLQDNFQPRHSRSYSNLVELVYRNREQSTENQGRNSSRNGKLVWLEDRKLWLLTEPSELLHNSHRRSETSGPLRQQTRYTQARQLSSPRRTQHSYWGDSMYLDDLPPSYESLGYNNNNNNNSINANSDVSPICPSSSWAEVARRRLTRW
jgi:hypothetical protein